MEESLTHAEVEDELCASPLCGETDVLVIIVDDESSQAQKTGIVSADVVSGRVGYLVRSNDWLISVISDNQVQFCVDPCNITDVECVDLSDSRD